MKMALFWQISVSSPKGDFQDGRLPSLCEVFCEAALLDAHYLWICERIVNQVRWSM